MWVWRHRYEELGAREDVEYVYHLREPRRRGRRHVAPSARQIYGYPFLPPVPALELAADARLGGCATCALVERELGDGARILHENDSVVAYVPTPRAGRMKCTCVLRSTA